MSEGWFADPDDPQSLRWWDGTQWTEHRAPAAQPETQPVDDAVLVRISVRDHDLVATADDLTIRGERFALADIDTVQWSAVRSRVNGAYMGTLFVLRVRAGERKGDFPMSTTHKDERIDEFSDAYSRVVWLLDTIVCPRLAAEMAAHMRGGQTITLGPAGARVELTAEGFRLKKPLSKVVPWARVAGTEDEGGRIWFRIRKDGRDEPKRHSMVPLDGDNIVVLPHLTQLMAGVG